MPADPQNKVLDKTLPAEYNDFHHLRSSISSNSCKLTCGTSHWTTPTAWLVVSLIDTQSSQQDNHLVFKQGRMWSSLRGMIGVLQTNHCDQQGDLL